MKDNPLFTLIQSLTKAEKIYFRKQAATFVGKQSAYLELFDAIADQKEYDENALRQQFKGKPFLKQLAVLKNYLYEALLDSLVRFRAKDDTEIQLYQTKQAVAVLMEKKMLKPALRLLKKAIDKAEKEERFIIATNLLTLQHKLLVNMQNDDLESQQKTWIQTDDYVAKFQNVQAFQRLHASVLHWLKKDRHARSPQTAAELDKLIQSPLLQDINQANSFWAKMFFFSTHDAYLKAKGNFEQSIHYARASIEAFEANPEMQKIDPQNNLGVIVNFLNAAYYTNNIDLLLEGIQKLKEITFSDFKLENLRRSRYVVFSFSYMKIANDFSQFDTLCKEAVYLIEQHKPEIVATEKRLICYNALHNSIRLGRYTDALDWRLRMAELTKSQVQSDFQRFERLLEILIHYALGNEELVLALCQNAARQLSPLSGYEALVLSLFRHLPKLPYRERDTAMAQHLGQLEQLFTENATEKKALEYFDIMLWIKARLKNKPMVELTMDN